MKGLVSLALTAKTVDCIFGQIQRITNQVKQLRTEVVELYNLHKKKQSNVGTQTETKEGCMQDYYWGGGMGNQVVGLKGRGCRPSACPLWRSPTSLICTKAPLSGHLSQSLGFPFLPLERVLHRLIPSPLQASCLDHQPVQLGAVGMGGGGPIWVVHCAARLLHEKPGRGSHCLCNPSVLG